MAEVEPYLVKIFKDRASWLDGRKNSIGGSEAPALFGSYGYQSQLALQMSKLGQLPEDEDPSRALRFDAALALEATSSRDAERLLGAAVVAPVAEGQAIYYSREVEHAHATPDRFVLREKPQRIHPRTLPKRASCVLSLKNWNSHDKKAWEGVPPLYALIQLQHELMVLGLEVGRIHVLFGAGDSSLVTPEFEAHPGIQEQLRNRIPEWWQKHIVLREPCPPTEEDASLLKLLYPTAKPGSFVILAGEDWQRKYSRLVRLKRFEKFVESKTTELEVEIKDAMKENEFAVFEEGAISWKSFDRNEAPRPARTVSVRSFRTDVKIPKGVQHALASGIGTELSRLDSGADPLALTPGREAAEDVVSTTD